MGNYTYQLPSELGYNTTQGADQYFAWIGAVSPKSYSFFLIFVWCFIFIAGNITERKLTGKDELIKWGFTASLINLIIAVLLGISGLIGTPTIVICIGVMALFTMLKFS